MNFGTLDPNTAPLDFLDFAHHCDALSNGRSLPRQQDFSVANVSWLNDRLYRLDVHDGGVDYYFRNVGIFWQAAYGENFSGHWLSEIETITDKYAIMRKTLERVCAAQVPFFCRTRLVWPGKAELEFERLMVPFTLDGETVSQILVVAHCDEANEDKLFEPRIGLPTLQFDSDIEPLQIAS